MPAGVRPVAFRGVTMRLKSPRRRYNGTQSAFADFNDTGFDSDLVRVYLFAAPAPVHVIL